MTYYEVLEVGEKSSSEVISAAYRALAKKYHPDVNTNSNADFMMKRINEAFDVLSDPDKRVKYDEYLRTQRQRAADEERARQEAEAQQKAEYERAEQARKAAEEKAKEAAEARRQQQENCYKKAVGLFKKKHLGVKNYLAIAELFEQAGQFSDAQIQADTYRRLAQKKFSEKQPLLSRKHLLIFSSALIVVVCVLAFSVSNSSPKNRPDEYVSPTNDLPSNLYFASEDSKHLTVGNVWRVPYHSELHGKSDSDIVWASSDPSVVTAEKYGKVTAVSEGEAQISISLDGIKKDTITIIVS